MATYKGAVTASPLLVVTCTGSTVMVNCSVACGHIKCHTGGSVPTKGKCSNLILADQIKIKNKLNLANGKKIEYTIVIESKQTIGTGKTTCLAPS